MTYDKYFNDLFSLMESAIDDLEISYVLTEGAEFDFRAKNMYDNILKVGNKIIAAIESLLIKIKKNIANKGAKAYVDRNINELDIEVPGYLVDLKICNIWISQLALTHPENEENVKTAIKHMQNLIASDYVSAKKCNCKVGDLLKTINLIDKEFVKTKNDFNVIMKNYKNNSGDFESSRVNDAKNVLIIFRKFISLLYESMIAILNAFTKKETNKTISEAAGLTDDELKNVSFKDYYKKWIQENPGKNPQEMIKELIRKPNIKNAITNPDLADSASKKFVTQLKLWNEYCKKEDAKYDASKK